jgi:hypothetical protein
MQDRRTCGIKYPNVANKFFVDQIGQKDPTHRNEDSKDFGNPVHILEDEDIKFVLFPVTSQYSNRGLL